MHTVPHDDEGKGVGLLLSPVRRALVDLLASDQSAPDGPRGMTAAQLATALELHVSTVRFHVDQLVAAGLLEAEFTSAFGVGRPRKIYRTAPGSLSQERDSESLKMLAGLLANTFSTDLTPAEAGQRWAEEHVPLVDEPPASTPGAWLGKVGRMVDVLQQWGYTPELRTTDGGRTAKVDLHDCPFLEMAESSPAVVCGIHRGLIDGALQRLGENDTVVSLQPLIAPGRCAAEISTRTPFRPRTRKTE